MKPLPTLFVSHGSPMTAVEPGELGPFWDALGKKLPRPSAVLIASAHWETTVPMLTGNPRPATIHDFSGFPPALYELSYPAPGDPDLAARAVTLLKQAGIAAGIDGCRGLDHGAWVPLRYMYPKAQIPVVQLALQPERGARHHLDLGRALAPLAAEGVLIIGSGHATHNLRDWMTTRRSEPLPYAQAFVEWLHERLLADDTEAVLAYRERVPDAARAHPTDEHFLPLFAAWGAAGDESRAERVFAGYQGAALALDAYLFHQQTA